MPTQFTIAKPDEQSELIPITMTMHDDVVLVRIPRRTASNGPTATKEQPLAVPSVPVTFMDFPDDEEPTWEDAEWR